MTAKARGPLQGAALPRWVPAAAAAAVVLAVVALFIGRDLISPASPHRSAGPTDQFVRFRDPATAISILRPAGWRRVVSPDPSVRLLVEGNGSSMLVRVTDLEVNVGPSDLGAAKRLTDKLVRSAGDVTLLRPPRKLTLAGLPGYLYLYTFPDAASGRLGAHAHYFLFRGRTLITIVFQTVPGARLAGLAPFFDRLSETLRTPPR